MNYIDGKNAEEFSNVNKPKVGCQIEEYCNELQKIEFDNYGYFNWSDYNIEVFSEFETWKKALEDEISTMCKSVLQTRFKS
jgi:hypothetical protein